MDSHSLQWGQKFAPSPPSTIEGTFYDPLHSRRRDESGHRSQEKASFLASKEAIIVIFLLIQLLNAFDAFATLRLVARCGWVCEANPIMRALGESVSVQVWIVVKLGVVFLLTSLIANKKGEWLLWVLLPLMSVGILHLLAS